MGRYWGAIYGEITALPMPILLPEDTEVNTQTWGFLFMFLSAATHTHMCTWACLHVETEDDIDPKETLTM